MSSADDRNSLYAATRTLRLACVLGVGETCLTKDILWEMPFLPRIGEVVVIDDFSSRLPMKVWGITFDAVDDEIVLHVSFPESDSDDIKYIEEYVSGLLDSGWSFYENLIGKVSDE